MSTENYFLSIRTEGPLQSWGFDSKFIRRKTALLPTKSAIAGICCASLGCERGSDNEKKFLTDFNKLKMTAISIPKKKADKELLVRRLIDFHSVEGTIRASGSKNPNAVLTYRHYLMDAFFGVILSGKKIILEQIKEGLCNPKWGLWLGRKNCIPTAPLFAGLFSKEKEAISCLTGTEKLNTFTYQVDSDDFKSGTDALFDCVISFNSGKREFLPRRITTHHEL
jgi:CRISPR system Cascade subunit CasD